MDIKIEPYDELLSSIRSEQVNHGLHCQNSENDVLKEEYSIEIKYEVSVKQEDTIIDEAERKEPSQVTIQIDCGKEKGQLLTTNAKSSINIELPPMNTPQDKLISTSQINKIYLKQEILLKKGVFYKQNFVCSVCFALFPSSQLLQKHRIIHNKSRVDMKIFQCEQCDYKSTNKYNLKTHKLIHSSEKLHKCDQCSFKSTRKCHLKTHSMTHTIEKRNKCDQCSFTSVRGYDLKKHKMLHIGLKPFKCDQCSLKFVHSSYLKKHKLSHTGRKPFKCDICIFKSARAYDLKKHEKLHIGEKAFKCDQCSYQSAHSSYVKKHTMSHINEKA